MNIALIGPSGVGKGTYADKLVSIFNLQQVVTGQLFRENLENRSAVGLLAKRYIKRGQLVPDEIVDALVEELLWKMPAEQNILFDGFPRTVYQAKFLDELFAESGRELDAAIYINVSDEEIRRRLSGRIICRECQTPFHQDFNPFKRCPYNKCEGEFLYQRDDDNPETVRARLTIFHTQTAPLVKYYKEDELLIEVNGGGDVSEVNKRTLAAMDTLREAK